MAKKLRTQLQVASNGYTVNDRRGQTKESLYSTPSQNPTEFRPTYYNIDGNPDKIITAEERIEHIRLCREIFATVPLIAAAVKNKNNICVGNAWTPTFTGEIRNSADQKWVDSTEAWLVNQYYPKLSFNNIGQGMLDVLYLTGLGIDICGGSFMIPRKTTDGIPKIQLISVDRIGSRNGETEIKVGSYKGDKIYDGVITSAKSGLVVGYKILGSTPDKDQIVSAYSGQLIFESQWANARHGMPSIATTVNYIRHIKDITDANLVSIKNYSEQGFIVKNVKGAAPKGKAIFGEETTATANQIGKQSKIFFENNLRGRNSYISSTDGSEIEPFDFNRPTPQLQEFLYGLQSQAVASLGWFIELIIPQKTNGTTVRLIQDQSRKLIVSRQMKLEERAKAIVQYGISQAMIAGIIPTTDNPTFLQWGFNKPAELTVDNGYDSSAQIEALKLGITTKADLCARRGKDWYEVDKQNMVELRSMFDNAKTLAAEYGISEAEAREWLRNQNIKTLAPQPVVEDSEDEDSKTK